MKILYVEDVDINFKVLDAMITALWGWKLERAETGKKALENIMNQEFDLVFMDIGLPDFSGLDVVAEVRSNTNITMTPIVMLTADATVETKSKAYELGCDEYMVKPYNAAKLKEIIEKFKIT